MEKVLIELEPDKWHGFSTESVWATKLGDDLFRLENSPFFANGLSYEDVIKTTLKERVNYFIETVSSSGRSTYRIIPNNAADSASFERYWQPIEDLGCSFEQGNFGFILFAVDVPSNTDIHQVFALLEEGVHNKVWEFEEGHCSHSI